MRIAMPDLRYIVEKYLEGRSVGDAEADGRATPLQLDSPARLLNVALRSWGHLYLYDFEELQLRLRQAGFSDVVRQAAGSSSVRDLCGLERRVASRLVVEARA
jgi:predicted SAM-dependent methyltransferase